MKAGKSDRDMGWVHSCIGLGLGEAKVTHVHLCVKHCVNLKVIWIFN